MNLGLRFGAFLLASILAGGIAQAQQSCPVGYPVSTPNSDFADADAGNGTVRHIPTGLIWKRCAEGQIWNGSTCTGTADGYTWQQAFQRADAVNAGSAGTQNAGHTDWRVPNQKELRSIVERGCTNPSINLTQFPATPASTFWSGSPFAGFSVGAWLVVFGNGYDDWNNRGSARQVRLVRAGQYFYNFDAAVTAPSVPVISTGAPPGGTVGTAYNFTVIASGSPTFSATGLPPGLGIDPASGVISGTPTTPGSFDATITATNGGGPTSANYTMAIAAAAVVTTPTAVPTLSEWGGIVLSLLMAGAAVLGLRRRE